MGGAAEFIFLSRHIDRKVAGALTDRNLLQDTKIHFGFGNSLIFLEVCCKELDEKIDNNLMSDP